MIEPIPAATLLYKVSKSVLPCIIFHAVGNVVVSYYLSIEDGLGMIISVCIQIIFAIGVSIFFDKKIM